MHWCHIKNKKTYLTSLLLELWRVKIEQFSQNFNIEPYGKILAWGKLYLIEKNLHGQPITFFNICWRKMDVLQIAVKKSGGHHVRFLCRRGQKIKSYLNTSAWRYISDFECGSKKRDIERRQEVFRTMSFARSAGLTKITLNFACGTFQ